MPKIDQLIAEAIESVQKARSFLEDSKGEANKDWVQLRSYNTPYGDHKKFPRKLYSRTNELFGKAFATVLPALEERLKLLDEHLKITRPGARLPVVRGLSEYS